MTHNGVTVTSARRIATAVRTGQRTGRMKMLELTPEEARTLEQHLEWYIIQEIKDDADYDSIGYLTNLIHVYEKCKAEEGE